VLSRGENGKLRLKHFVLDVILDDLFEKCKDETEVLWLLNHLKGSAAVSAGTKLDEIKNDVGELLETPIKE